MVPAALGASYLLALQATQKQARRLAVNATLGVLLRLLDCPPQPGSDSESHSILLLGVQGSPGRGPNVSELEMELWHFHHSCSVLSAGTLEI